MLKHTEAIMMHIAYLEDTLIPDLQESGRDETAEDFQTCCKYLRELLEEIDNRSVKQSLNPPLHRGNLIRAPVSQHV